MSQTFQILARLGHEAIRFAPFAVLVCDHDNIIRLANSKATELLTVTQPSQHSSESQLVGKSALDVISGVNLNQIGESPSCETLLVDEQRIGIELHQAIVNLDGRDWKIFYINETDKQRRRELLLEREASTDELSGLPNRRAFQRTMEGNQHRPLSLAIVDIDYFKAVNDAFGHPVGDDVVKHTGRLLNESFDEAAILTARMGGDEFSVLFETTDTASIVELVENFRSAFSQSKVPEHPDIELTVSIGVAICQVPRIGSRTLLTSADKQLYLAKNAGRNQVAYMKLDDTNQKR